MDQVNPMSWVTSLVPAARSLFAEMHRRRHLLYYPLVTLSGCMKPPFQGFLALEECFAKLAPNPCRPRLALKLLALGSSAIGSISCYGTLFVPFGCSFSIIMFLSPHRWTLGVTQSDRIPDQACTYVPFVSRLENSLSAVTRRITCGKFANMTKFVNL
ncbi:hypothetical protein EDB82DRAFT_491915 [Fusarium venenatum]|uniref:uncharacterized protein n=1 Tax=Fusarium venenatum TaxID=56646 RepID=UPI001DA592A4|nr:hypothetical protein EDB82DRAFT_491915 [Fusarium venenatum]